MAFNPSTHEHKVREIAAQVSAQAARGEPLTFTRRGVHHVVPLPGDSRFRGHAIDLSALDQVLEIDVAARRCVAEPGVTFARLVEATLAHGLLPTVVPELEGITVGGAVAGCSVEAMSYRYGGFHDSCLEYEVITGEGEILTCSPDQEPLCFGMIHGSYGTLGLLTRVTFRLVPAKPFVELEYRKLGTAEAFLAELQRCCATGEAELVDGIIHGPADFVLCLGRFVDHAARPSSYRSVDIYYKSTLARSKDTLTTADYCFRYDTDCHWLTRTVPPLEWKLVRRLAGSLFLGSEKLIAWSNRLARILALKKRPEVVCDVFIPAGRWLEFYRWYERDFRFFPLWIVPYRAPAPYPWLADERARRLGTELILDCAVYGKPNSEPDVDYSVLLEEKTYELDGIKTLISRNHYTAERFWSVYHQANYRAVKARLDPRGAFPDLFERFARVE
jgi:FAD/FMN-containing dehydrogenase